MAILGKDDFMNRLKERIGEDTSDEAISFLEDITDTVNDLESRAGSGDNWKKKYEENDLAWKQKYKERFFNTEVKDDENEFTEEKTETVRKYTYDELFSEKGE